MMNGKVRAFNGDMGMAMSVFKDMVGKVRFVFADPLDNTATSSYWMLTNEYMVDEFDYAKELQPYKGMGLCSECGRLATSPDGRDVVVPGKWHGKFPKEKATEEQMKHVGYKNLI